MEKNYKTLELDKVLEMLKAETSCEDAGELALNIKPCNDFITLCNMLNQTEDAAVFALIFRRISYSVSLALSAISSSLMIQDKILSSRYLFVVMQSKSKSRLVLTPEQ